MVGSGRVRTGSGGFGYCRIPGFHTVKTYRDPVIVHISPFSFTQRIDPVTEFMGVWQVRGRSVHRSTSVSGTHRSYGAGVETQRPRTTWRTSL